LKQTQFPSAQPAPAFFDNLAPSSPHSGRVADPPFPIESTKRTQSNPPRMFPNLRECSLMFGNVQRDTKCRLRNEPNTFAARVVHVNLWTRDHFQRCCRARKWLYTQIGKIVPCSSGATRPKPLAVSHRW